MELAFCIPKNVCDYVSHFLFVDGCFEEYESFVMDPSSTNRQRLRSMPQSKSFVRLLRAFIRQIINRPSIQAQASNSIKFPSGYAFPYSSHPEDNCLSAALVYSTFVCYVSCLASPKKRYSLNEVDAHCKPVIIFGCKRFWRLKKPFYIFFDNPFTLE